MRRELVTIAAAPSIPAATGRVAIWTSWALQIAISAILAQTLYFKFTYAPETRFIFAKLGGRPAATLAGLAELACVVLLLTPRLAPLGALLSLGVMAGALATHLFVIGIESRNPDTGIGDGGLLFGLALAVTALALGLLWLRRAELADLWRRLPRLRSVRE